VNKHFAATQAASVHPRIAEWSGIPRMRLGDWLSVVASDIRRFIVGISATHAAALGSTASRIWLTAGATRVFYAAADDSIWSRIPDAESAAIIHFASC
jgi:hypothetical protein